MSISLVKGQKISLTKDNNGLTKIRVGLGWDSANSRKNTEIKTTKEKTKNKGFFYTLGSVLKGEARVGDAVNSAVDSTRSVINGAREEISDCRSYTSTTTSIDIDASMILLQNDKFVSNQDLIYFGNKSHISNSVKHMGDNITGDGEGDDEVIYTDLSKIPSNINKLVCIINIYNCTSKNQHFGMIGNAYVRIYDDSTNKVLCQFDLTDDYSNYTGIYVGEIYRYNGEWKFSATGEGSKSTCIQDMLTQYK
jgi:stress response protein SCP2